MPFPTRNLSVVLPTVVVAQLLCTSMWFAGNSVVGALADEYGLGHDILASLTSSVQVGFIAGTLVYALLGIADRFPPSKVFMVSALLGSIANAAVTWGIQGEGTLMASRFTTGFFLAGIYPVGMKIVSDYFELGLGKALGWLVGALVMGTALPHLIRAYDATLSWRLVFWFTSALTVVGALAVGLGVAPGPHRKPAPRMDMGASLKVFRNKAFRIAAFGYFGHMWELYTFWAFLPTLLTMKHPGSPTAWPTFVVIASGAIGCITGGLLARKAGSEKVAYGALIVSGLCCLAAGWLLSVHIPDRVWYLFLVLWGLTVVADSPQFSALVAQTAPPERKGTALTVTTCIGFSITIGSIYCMQYVISLLPQSTVFMLLAIGPALALANRFAR
ncbi:MAG: MFS transporter [Flavobacteriales bacterium]|nr:MFS transporter [Flavobacteriales bacterium]MCB9448208.1 MFS transporter [Flavobacteriales bacterium]